MDHGEQGRFVRLVAGITTVYAALVGGPADCKTALAWFAPDRPPEGLDHVGWNGIVTDDLVGMLPYILDPFGFTTRRALLSGRGSVAERRHRKVMGTFYTPGDVARHLAERVIQGDERRVVDPACGAGVFLRAAFGRLCESMPPSIAVRRLYGVDLDLRAVDACALVLLHDWLRREPLGSETDSPVGRYFQLREHLVNADALELWDEREQLPLFASEVAGRGRLPTAFDAVLMNPPFARLSARPAPEVLRRYRTLAAATDPAAVNLIWPFWELANRLAGSEGRAGVVLPLSIAYTRGPVAREGRDAVLGSGHWEISFYDRTPDALFGDDVKQRVALGVRTGPAQGTVRTGPLTRWSADRRADVLGSTNLRSVERPVESDLILKIGSEAESRVVDHLRAFGAGLGASATRARLVPVSDLSQDENIVVVAPTAYNWLGLYRDPVLAIEGRSGAGGQLAELTFESAEAADAAYAVLVSHVALWWWRATGDLFHVPLTWLREAPFPLPRKRSDVLSLARAGAACWQEATANAVTAVNKGVRTIAYKTAEDSLALARADDAVGRVYGLPPEFVRLTRDDARRLRVAGRDQDLAITHS